jgi:hypothetical protein
MKMNLFCKNKIGELKFKNQQLHYKVKKLKNPKGGSNPIFIQTKNFRLVFSSIQNLKTNQ